MSFPGSKGKDRDYEKGTMWQTHALFTRYLRRKLHNLEYTLTQTGKIKVAGQRGLGREPLSEKWYPLASQNKRKERI